MDTSVQVSFIKEKTDKAYSIQFYFITEQK